VISTERANDSIGISGSAGRLLRSNLKAFHHTWALSAIWYLAATLHRREEAREAFNHCPAESKLSRSSANTLPSGEVHGFTGALRAAQGFHERNSVSLAK